MKFYLKHSFCSFGVFAACLMLVLVSCSDPVPRTVAGLYGEPANYIKNTSIDYPNFSIHFIEKKVSKAGAPEEVTTYSFQLTAGTHQQQIEWNDASYRMGSYDPFLYKGQKFVLDLKFSDFLDRELADGELIIWTQPQYEQFKHNKSQAREDKLRELTEPFVGQDLLRQRKEAATPLFEIYKEYLQALDMAELDNVASFLSNEDPKARAKQVEILFSRHESTLNALHIRDAAISAANAKLYISASSAKGDLLIGVTFIERQGHWKIIDERIMPDTAAGKEWIENFL